MNPTAKRFFKVAKLGERVSVRELHPETTVSDALATLGYSTEGHDVRVNNSPANANTPVNDGDIITLVPAIKGGSN